MIETANGVGLGDDRPPGYPVQTTTDHLSSLIRDQGFLIYDTTWILVMRTTTASGTVRSLSSSQGPESASLEWPQTSYDILPEKATVDNLDHTMFGYRQPPLFTHEHGCVTPPSSAPRLMKHASFRRTTAFCLDGQ